MTEDGLSDGDARSLRFLKGLVTVLTATMIVGVITIVVLLVIRLQRPDAPAFPDVLMLPDGVRPIAVTRGTDWTAVVTQDDRILILDPDGRVVQDIMVRPADPADPSTSNDP